MSLRVAAATGISDFGLSIFDRWSKKNTEKYDELHTRERWEEIKSSPPTKTGAGKIFEMATEAVPRWRSLIGLVGQPRRRSAEDGSDATVVIRGIAKGSRQEARVSRHVSRRSRRGTEGTATDDDDEVNLQGKPIKFEPIVPWPEEIDGRDLDRRNGRRNPQSRGLGRASSARHRAVDTARPRHRGRGAHAKASTQEPNASVRQDHRSQRGRRGWSQSRWRRRASPQRRCFE